MTCRSLLAILVIALATACAPRLPPTYKTAAPAPASLLSTIQARTYARPLPSRLQAFTSLSIRLPGEPASFWEGGLFLSQPETLTFEAVNDFGNTLFYFRYVKASGWMLESGDEEESVALPITGAQFVTLLLGRPPALPAEVRLLPQPATNAPGASQISTLSGDHEMWTFFESGLPHSYYFLGSSFRHSYQITWKQWREKNGVPYASDITFSDLKGRLRLHLVLHEVDIHR